MFYLSVIIIVVFVIIIIIIIVVIWKVNLKHKSLLCVTSGRPV